MLFMILERFRDGDARAVYRRARDRGRMLPDGVTYVASWVDERFERCFQIMDCAHVDELRPWTEQWKDLVDFEIVPVVTSQEAFARIAPLLDAER
jgi:hypothetical protein